MTTFFSTFITGFSEVVREVISKRFPDIAIDEVLDGIIVYSTSAAVQDILDQKYFNNTFVLLAKTDWGDDATTASIVKTLYKAANFGETRKILSLQKSSTFRISISRENELTSINNEIVRKIEEKIMSQTRLRVNRQGADVEFWFVIRSEGKAYCGMRITKLKAKPARGQLRPELAQLLCALSDPAPEDVFLDPCAGSGAIIAERVSVAPYRTIISGDSDQAIVADLKQRFKKAKNVRIERLDAADLKAIEASSIDKVVTDPPWGFYTDSDRDYADFYGRILAELKRVIKPTGQIVILTARKDELEKALDTFGPSMILKQKLNILVSGKKAAIYRLQLA